MSDPAYVSTGVNVLFDGTDMKAVIFVDGPPKFLIRWDQALVDARMQADIDYVIAQNGGAGSLPWSAEDFVTFTSGTTLPSNGQTFFNTYVKSIHVIGDKPTLPPAPIDQDLVYYDGSDWKYLYNDSAV